MIERKYLNNILREKAINSGLCQKWQEEWKEDWDEKKMAKQFFRGIDFYLKYKFVSTSDIKGLFDIGFLRANGIIVDDKYSLLNPSHAILIGDSVSVIRSNGRNISSVYVTGNSKAKIIVKDNAYTLVHILDKANVAVTAQQPASCTVIRHSKKAVAETCGNVTVKDEFSYLR